MFNIIEKFKQIFASDTKVEPVEEVKVEVPVKSKKPKTPRKRVSKKNKKKV